MKKQKPSLLLILGISLVAVSALLLGAVQIAMQFGAKHRQEILAEINGILPEKTQGIPENYSIDRMPLLEIENKDYVAILEIPAFGITLPVADTWNSNRLFLSPARFLGSTYDGTLIIGGMDDDRQFGFCDEVEHGTVITVTDMTGAQFTYEVSGIHRANHADPLWLADESSDLTLFCRSRNSMEYIAVRCILTYH